MKKFCITFLLSGIIILTAIGFRGGMFSAAPAADTEYLRIHIRADSNSSEDQAVKYLVRDAVVEKLTPIVASAHSQQEAVSLIGENLDFISRVADGVLRENGFTYGARAYLSQEDFPTRVYGEYTLEAGVYEALIVALGSGSGDNWWCVVYPPLCFAAQADEDFIYKSKIQEIIEEWKNNRD